MVASPMLTHRRCNGLALEPRYITYVICLNVKCYLFKCSMFHVTNIVVLFSSSTEPKRTVSDVTIVWNKCYPASYASSSLVRTHARHTCFTVPYSGTIITEVDASALRVCEGGRLPVGVCVLVGAVRCPDSSRWPTLPMPAC